MTTNVYHVNTFIKKRNSFSIKRDFFSYFSGVQKIVFPQKRRDAILIKLAVHLYQQKNVGEFPLMDKFKKKGLKLMKENRPLLIYI